MFAFLKKKEEPEQVAMFKIEHQLSGDGGKMLKLYMWEPRKDKYTSPYWLAIDFSWLKYEGTEEAMLQKLITTIKNRIINALWVMEAPLLFDAHGTEVGSKDV